MDYKAAFFSFLFVLSGSMTFAQDFEQQIQQLMDDSNYVEAYKYIKPLQNKYTSSHSLLELRLFLQTLLNEYEGLCDQISNAQRKKMHVNKFLLHYYNRNCQDVEKMPPSYQKMYAQKGQTKENGYKSVYSRSDSLRGSLNKWRSCYNVTFYDLHLRINTSKHTIAGSNTIRFTIEQETNRIQLDAHAQLTIDSILLAGKIIRFEREGNILFILFPDRLPRGSNFTLTVYYHGKPAKALNPPWEGGFVWKKAKSSSVWAGVACEHLGASFWWPCKDHPTDEPDSMCMSFEVPKKYKVISNGTLEKTMEVSGGYRQYNWRVKNPINAYNVTFYIGDFSSFSQPYTDINGISRTLHFYYLPENEEKAKSYFPFSTKVLKSYETHFGEYPFWSDGYALVESPYEGMEHQSAIAIGPAYGKSPYSNYVYDVVKDDFLILHETAHEWWGNSVTAFDMSDAWLQEGFGTFAEFLYIEDNYGPEVYVRELDYKRQFVLNLWPLLGNRGVNDNAFIGSDIYDKGALLLQNLRASIDNDSLFFFVLHSFAVKNRYKVVSTEDFIAHVQAITGKDFTPLFNAYLKEVAIPTLVYSYLKEGDGILLNYRWKNVPPDFKMSFGLKLSNKKYIKLEGTSEKKSIRISKTSHFQFISKEISLSGCPASYYAYFDTLLE